MAVEMAVGNQKTPSAASSVVDTRVQLDYFESCLGDAFDLRHRQPLDGGTRILYYAMNKKTSARTGHRA